jgi:hypothetical protein
MGIYILEGSMAGDFYDDHRCLISTDEEGIWSLIKNNKNWKSLAVYECPTTPIYRQDKIERDKFLDQVDLEKKEAAERELYLKLKEKYEKHV